MEPDEDGDQLSVGDEASGGKTGEGRESEIYLRNADEIPAAIELSSSVAPRLRYMNAADPTELHGAAQRLLLKRFSSSSSSRPHATTTTADCSAPLQIRRLADTKSFTFYGKGH
eukprot:gene18538-21676_t